LSRSAGLQTGTLPLARHSERSSNGAPEAEAGAAHLPGEGSVGDRVKSSLVCFLYIVRRYSVSQVSIHHLVFVSLSCCNYCVSLCEKMAVLLCASGTPCRAAGQTLLQI
jgi:hypothetical protein